MKRIPHAQEVDQGLKIVWREVQRLAIARGGVVQPGEVGERVAEIAQRLGVIRLDDKSLRYQLYGKIGPSCLKGSDAKKMQAVGVVGDDGKDLAIVPLGFSQSSGLMMPDRFGKNP